VAGQGAGWKVAGERLDALTSARCGARRSDEMSAMGQQRRVRTSIGAVLSPRVGAGCVGQHRWAVGCEAGARTVPQGSEIGTVVVGEVVVRGGNVARAGFGGTGPVTPRHGPGRACRVRFRAKPAPTTMRGVTVAPGIAGAGPSPWSGRVLRGAVAVVDFSVALTLG